MAKAVGIGGVFLRSEDPAELKDWYVSHLGFDLSPGAWIQEAGPTVFEPMGRESDYYPKDKAVMLNFRVDDLDGLMADLKGSGIEVETRAEWDSEIGRFARIHDPEGNPIELWEPAGPAAG